LSKPLPSQFLHVCFFFMFGPFSLAIVFSRDKATVWMGWLRNCARSRTSNHEAMNFEEKTVATGADKESGLPAFNAQAPCPPIAGVNDQCLAGDG
jgi:hypothetical protein